jgi:DNA-binding IclR family transcriptional regulator
VQRALGRAAFAVDDVAVMARLAGAETRVIATAEVPGAPCSGHYDRDATGLSHTLAVGRVILAHQPSEVAEEMIDLTRRTACARGDLFNEAELRDSLQATAERRFCVVVGEGDACVGAPVLGRDGSVHGAVAVVVEPRRLHRGLDRLVTAASAAAREISTALDSAAPSAGAPATSGGSIAARRI